MLFLTLKRANGLKTSYGEIFDKLLVFFDQKYHFVEILDTKTQKEIKILFKNTCVVFNPKTRKWAENELWCNNRQTFGLFLPKVPLT